MAKNYEKLEISTLNAAPVEEVGVSSTIVRNFSIIAIIILAISTLVIYIQNTNTAKVQAILSQGKAEEVDPPRGLFYDANGERLVTNTRIYQIWFKENEDKTLTNSLKQSISQVLGNETVNKSQVVTSASGEARFELQFSNDDRIKLISQLDKDLLSSIKFVETELRYYHYPQETAHILGYVSAVNQSELDSGYDLNDKVGRYGLEKLYENELKGLKVNDIKGRYNQLENNVLPGSSIFLTIDANWQKALHRVLERSAKSNNALGGAALIVNSNNGQIVASVNYPSFDTNKFSQGISPQEFKALADDIKQPLLDKTVGLQASPGSTLKLFGAYSLLNNSILTPYTTYLSDGCMKLGNSKFCEIDETYLGYVDLQKAIYRSSNIYFCKAMLQMEQKGGVEKWVEDIQKFGFGESTHSSFVGELSGLVASPENKMKIHNEKWYSGDTCNSVIGQGLTLVTPIQMAYAVNALVNGGKLYEPQILKEIKDHNGVVLKKSETKLVRQIEMNNVYHSTLMNAMAKTVSDSRGSAHSLYSLPHSLNLRAKTGSTEAVERINGVIKEGTHSWVVTVFDYKGETYTMIVHQRFGGRSFRSIPVVKDFLNCLVNNKLNSCN